MDEKTRKIVQEPSPVKAVVKKVFACAVCAYIFVKFINLYPIKNIKGIFFQIIKNEMNLRFNPYVTDDAFLNNNSIFYNFWYILMCTTTVRFKYYFAWLLADAIIVS